MQYCYTSWLKHDENIILTILNKFEWPWRFSKVLNSNSAQIVKSKYDTILTEIAWTIQGYAEIKYL